MFQLTQNPPLVLLALAAKARYTLSMNRRFILLVLAACAGALLHRPCEWASTRNTFFKDAQSPFTAIAKKALREDAEIKKLKQ